MTAFVASFVTPLIAAIGGKPDFSGARVHHQRLAVHLRRRSSTRCSSFLIIAAVVFFLIVRPLNALMEHRRTEEPVAEVTRACPECLSQIPNEARRCAFCTAEVGTA